MYVLQGAELGAGRAAPEHARWSPRVTLLPQPALWGPRPHPPGWICAPPRQQPPPPGRGPPGAWPACFAPPWPCSLASSLGPGICPFRVLGKASCTRRATPSPPSLPDPRPRSVLTGQRPHLPGPGRFRSRRRGPAWRAPGRVRPGPPWAFAPSLMPRTASGSLGTAACREALGSLLFSGACVSRTWCCSMPGPSRGPAHQRQLATGCPGP